MSSPIEHRNIVTRLRDFILSVNGMHWVLHPDSCIAQASSEFMSQEASFMLSFNAAVKQQLWIEACTAAHPCR